MQSLIWIVRIATVYLCFWWEFMFLSFSNNVTVGDLNPLVYIKSAVFFLLLYLPVWIATMKMGKRLKWILVIPITATLIYYANSLTDKILIVDIVGVLTDIAAIYIMFSKPLYEEVLI
jgi:hypothetical protein